MKLFIITTLLVFTITSCSSILTNNKEVRLTGMFSYTADAALFTDCKTHKQYPVASERDNISLEKTYLKVCENPGEKILVTLTGYFELQDKTEGEGKKEFLVVTKFDKIFPHIDCNGNTGTAKLQNTFWALRKLNGTEIDKTELKREMHFIINGNRVKGFAVCNNFSGLVTVSDDSLKFGKFAEIPRLCKTNQQLERDFLNTLNGILKFKIYGEFLYLYKKGKRVAIFESVYFS